MLNFDGKRIFLKFPMISPSKIYQSLTLWSNGGGVYEFFSLNDDLIKFNTKNNIFEYITCRVKGNIFQKVPSRLKHYKANSNFTRNFIRRIGVITVCLKFVILNDSILFSLSIYFGRYKITKRGTRVKYNTRIIIIFLYSHFLHRGVIILEIFHGRRKFLG